MNVITTLGFAGRTEEALNFYHKALDAETLFLMRFRDSPDQSHTPPGMEDRIFHATFRVGDTELMASDVGCHESQSAASFTGFALAVKADSDVRAKQIFETLSDGGIVVIPLARSAFTSWYGIVTDRFGVSWKIMVK